MARVRFRRRRCSIFGRVLQAVILLFCCSFRNTAKYGIEEYRNYELAVEQESKLCIVNYTVNHYDGVNNIQQYLDYVNDDRSRRIRLRRSNESYGEVYKDEKETVDLLTPTISCQCKKDNRALQAHPTTEPIFDDKLVVGSLHAVTNGDIPNTPTLLNDHESSISRLAIPCAPVIDHLEEDVDAREVEANAALKRTTNALIHADFVGDSRMKLDTTTRHRNAGRSDDELSVLSFDEVIHVSDEKFTLLKSGQSLIDVPREGCKSLQTENTAEHLLLLPEDDHLNELCLQASHVSHDDDDWHYIACDQPPNSTDMMIIADEMPDYPTDTKRSAGEKLGHFASFEDNGAYNVSSQYFYQDSMFDLGDHSSCESVEVTKVLSTCNNFMLFSDASTGMMPVVDENENEHLLPSVYGEKDCLKEWVEEELQMELYHSKEFSLSSNKAGNEKAADNDKEKLRGGIDIKGSLMQMTLLRKDGKKSFDVIETKKVVEKTERFDGRKTQNPSAIKARKPRKRSEVSYKERNRIAAREYRLRKKKKVAEDGILLKEIKIRQEAVQKQFDVTKRRGDELQQLLDSNVALYLENLINGSIHNDEEQKAEIMFSLIKGHLSNIQHNRSLDEEAEINLFRNSIMPVLRARYPSLYRRVEELWMVRISAVKEVTTSNSVRYGCPRAYLSTH